MLFVTVMNIIMLRLIMVAALSQLVDRVMQAAQWGSAAGARGVRICGPVLPTLMTRLHHSSLLSNKSYLITGQIYQSDVIIYTSILELSLEFKLQELLLFFILKYHATVNANGQLTCNVAILQTHGAKLHLLMEQTLPVCSVTMTLSYMPIVNVSESHSSILVKIKMSH